MSNGDLFEMNEEFFDSLFNRDVEEDDEREWLRGYYDEDENDDELDSDAANWDVVMEITYYWPTAATPARRSVLAIVIDFIRRRFNF